MLDERKRRRYGKEAEVCFQENSGVSCAFTSHGNVDSDMDMPASAVSSTPMTVTRTALTNARQETRTCRSVSAAARPDIDSMHKQFLRIPLQVHRPEAVAAARGPVTASGCSQPGRRLCRSPVHLPSHSLVTGCLAVGVHTTLRTRLVIKAAELARFRLGGFGRFYDLRYFLGGF